MGMNSLFRAMEVKCTHTFTIFCCINKFHTSIFLRMKISQRRLIGTNHFSKYLYVPPYIHFFSVRKVLNIKAYSETMI